jgi:hypothetical protein
VVLVGTVVVVVEVVLVGTVVVVVEVVLVGTVVGAWLTCWSPGRLPLTLG